MSVNFSKLRVGEPVCYEALSIFPLFSEVNSQVEYVLSDEALATEAVVVEEVSEGGSVPDLVVENRSDHRVLFLEGEELVGAKQNRILNTSVLVAARSRTMIPVSCVEQGRWAYRSRKFKPSGAHTPPELRRKLRKSVHRSVKEKRGRRSDQGDVWQEVAKMQSAHEVQSPTKAMSDTFESYKDRMAKIQKRLNYVEGAAGVAVALGGKVISLDVFDKPATCEKVWKRLLSGVVLDALKAGSPQQPAKVADIERLLGITADLNWEQAERIGEGDEYRAESPQGDCASALVSEETVVHGSIMTAE